jgi:type IV pilus assembly protein PilA
MKKNGFTLIELLVVVAIIGILAAVGVTAYSGYTSSARIATANANQKSVIKWIAAEAQKFQLGIDMIMNGEVSCAAISAQIGAGGNPAGTTVMAIQRALEGQFRNPYGANWQDFGDEGVREGGWGNERDLGYVLLNAGGDTGFFRISVSVCTQLPCTGDKWDNPGDNVIVKVYRWFP